jgi:hypothetical protein
VVIGWALSDPWTAQFEFELPTTGTTVTSYQIPVCNNDYYQPCSFDELRREERRQEPTVSVLFGRHLPPLGRFRAVVLFGPGARFDRLSERSVTTASVPAGQYQGMYQNYSYEHTYTYPAFVMGVDGVISVNRHVSVVPQLRVYVSPSDYLEMGPALIRPGVSVRWVF